MTKTNHKKNWLAVLIVFLFLALVLFLDQKIKPTNSMYMLMTVLQKGSVYALAAVSMNLLNGYTGLFSLGHAGFMLIGAYAYAIFTIPAASRDTVYQYYDAAVRVSFPEVSVQRSDPREPFSALSWQCWWPASQRLSLLI